MNGTTNESRERTATVIKEVMYVAMLVDTGRSF